MKERAFARSALQATEAATKAFTWEVSTRPMTVGSRGAPVTG